jgi:hypothetical protein
MPRIYLDSLEPRTLFSAAVPSLINAGGGAFGDSVGRTFIADVAFAGGVAGQLAPYDVQNTNDDALFLSWREGASFSYSIPVVNGHYALFLEFAEPTLAAGQRQFNVSAESASILSNFDIAQTAGGSGIAVAKSFDVTVSDGALNLDFTGVANNALVSAIAVVPTDVPDESTPYSSLPWSDATRITQSQANLYSIGQGMFLYAAENKGKFPPNLATLRSTQDLPERVAANPRTSTLVPRGELTDLEAAAWIAGRSDYIYLGAGKKASGAPDAVLAYENPNREYGDIGILWGDGHASLLDRASAAALLDFSNVPPSDPPPPPPTVAPADPNVLASQQNLHAIASAIQAYANNNKGRYPINLGTLFDANYVSDLHIFVNPRGRTQLPPDSASKAEKVAWINSSLDYLYAAAGQRYTQFAPWEVMLSENPAQMTGGLNILLGDGRVDFREIRWASETLHRRRPEATGGGFSYASSPPSLNAHFDVPGISVASVDASDVTLRNLDTNQLINLTGVTASYDINFNNLKFILPLSVVATLPEGHYRTTIPAGAVSDVLGNTLQSDATFDTFYLTGDADGSGHVDTFDFMLMARNFNGAGGFPAAGDFNFDGRVNALDFNLLATKFGSTASSPSAPANAARPAASISLFGNRAINAQVSRLAGDVLPF